MKTAYVSSQSISTALRLSVMKGQVAMRQATQEATSGRFADVGLAIGAASGRDTVLRYEFAQIEALLDTNELVSGRLEASQAALSGLADTAQEFVKSLFASRGAENGGQVILAAAKGNLASLVGTLNASFSGQFVFAGINTDTRPVTPYEAGAANKAALDAAFLAHFGFSQTDPAVAGITKPDMQAFLDTTFADLFDPANWAANWSSASDQNVRSRISTTETIETSVNANELAFRKLAMVYTMASDLGGPLLGQGAFEALVDTAVEQAGSAIYELTLQQGTLGTAQERIKKADDRLSVQKDLVNRQVNLLEAVDPAEASVRVKAIEGQIETALALTVRVQNLSLLHYL